MLVRGAAKFVLVDPGYYAHHHRPQRMDLGSVRPEACARSCAAVPNRPGAPRARPERRLGARQKDATCLDPDPEKRPTDGP